jgi:predicted metalloprotease
VAAITYPDLSNVQVVGGFLTLAVLFVIREFASGALKKAGEEFWIWARRRHSGGRIAGSDVNGGAENGNHAEAGRLIYPLRGAAQRTPASPRDGCKRQGYKIPFPEVVHDLNAFWQRSFGAFGTMYRAPTVKTLEAPVVTACGPAGPEDLAFYCPVEEAVYYSPVGLDEHRRRIGDFAPIVVMAHEWGHHLQTLLGLAPRPGNAFELQADCLAGAYASDAGQRGLLDPGDITEAVAMAATAGDPLGLPQDMSGAHGINDDRITAFMRGYLGGVDACVLLE